MKPMVAKEIKKITLCLWVYVAANISKATVMSVRQKLLFTIHGNPKKFIVNYSNWNRYCTVYFIIILNFVKFPKDPSKFSATIDLRRSKQCFSVHCDFLIPERLTG